MDLLTVAKQIQQHLGAYNLPKRLIDDTENGIDPESRTDDELLLAHFKEDSLHSIKTVRFLKDFYNYRAGFDLETKNESFLKTAKIFRTQGIKNFHFLLQLNNPLLKGVDPYDPNITEEQKIWVMQECKENFWYFLREVCQLKDGIFFKANRGNISFLWTWLNHLTTYMIMPRQQGKDLEDNAKVRVKTTEGAESIYNTWKRIGDICTGDTIIGTDGKESLVIGVHPQGVKRLYEVTFNDGRIVRAGAEHLWTVWDKSRGRTGCWVDYTTAVLKDKLKSPYYRRNPIEIPLITPQEMKSKNHSVDPYFMALLYCSHADSSNSLCLVKDKKNKDILSGVKVPDSYVVQDSERNVTISRKDGAVLTVDHNVGLPVEYLEGSVEDRLRLLHGLMDAKGYVSGNVLFRSPHPKIRTQVQYLIRSLGGTAEESNQDLIVTLPSQFEYFLNAKWDFDRPENVLYVKDVAYWGDATATCIEVDHENQMFITDDFVSTHNTVTVQVINFWLTYIVGRGYWSHIITLKSGNRSQLIEAIRRIRTCLPKYMINSTYKDKDAGTEMTYRSFGESVTNKITISVPQTGEDAAGDVGRGFTVGNTTIDEPAYVNWIEAIVNGCMPSALTEMQTCRRLGLPYGINYITTPNTTRHASGKYMHDRLMSATEWRERYFDCFGESHLSYCLKKSAPTLKAPDGSPAPQDGDAEDTSPKVAMVYNYLQLGKDKNWVRKVATDLNLSLSKTKIDFLLMWTEDGENRLFDDLTREAINETKRDVVWSKEYPEMGMYFDFFITEAEYRQMASDSYHDFLLIGCDTSSASGKDACTIVIRSIKTGKVVGVGRYSRAYLDDVGTILVDLLETMPNSMLVIERNYAHQMIDNLLTILPAKGMDPFKRIFNSIYQNPIKYQKEFQESQRVKPQHRTRDFYLRIKEHFGFVTNPTTREEFYGYIEEAVGVTGYGLHYDKLCDELIDLRLKGGRIDHDNNKHDDLVVAWLLTYWFIKKGESRSLYGISPGIALTDTVNLLRSKEEHEAGMTPQQQTFVINLKEKLAKLTDELLATNDNILALRIEAEIRKISRALPVETRGVLTVETLLSQAKMERNRRMMENINRRYR